MIVKIKSWIRELYYKQLEMTQMIYATNLLTHLNSEASLWKCVLAQAECFLIWNYAYKLSINFH